MVCVFHIGDIFIPNVIPQHGRGIGVFIVAPLTAVDPRYKLRRGWWVGDALLFALATRFIVNYGAILFYCQLRENFGNNLIRLFANTNIWGPLSSRFLIKNGKESLGQNRFLCYPQQPKSVIVPLFLLTTCCQFGPRQSHQIFFLDYRPVQVYYPKSKGKSSYFFWHQNGIQRKSCAPLTLYKVSGVWPPCQIQ